METVQAGTRVAKRIIKKSKFFCVVFKEVVSCFFQAPDISADCNAVPPNEGFKFQILNLELVGPATSGAVL